MKPWTGEAGALSERIAERIRHTGIRGPASATDDDAFGELALALHRWQHQNNPVVRALTSDPPRHWSDIPAVPVDLFKHLHVTCFPEHEASTVFRTSGTTRGTRGTHRLRSTALYDLGATTWAMHFLKYMPPHVVALLSDPTDTPDSSLSHMVSLFPSLADPPGRISWHVHDGKLDPGGPSEQLLHVRQPVFVASTSFALAQWLAFEPPPLPTGSVLMITGGFKGRIRHLDERTLLETARAQLAPARVVTEYGMTELSSQLWSDAGSPYVPPPWMRVLPLDPATGEVRPPGSRGQLRFIDLCNLDSSVAIDTMDEGIVDEDGTVTLLGRLADAPTRGCSLSVEDTWITPEDPS